MIEKNKKLPRIIILGSSGFVGKNLSIALKALDADHLGITSQDIDLTKEGSIEQLTRMLKPEDCVIILSTLTPRKGKGCDTFIKNMQIANHVSQALINVKGISQVIYFSSDAVYSLEDSLIDESSKISNDLYGMMHYSRELVFKTIGLPLTIVRSTLIYGSGDPHNSYGPNRLIKQAITNGKLSLFGKGEETRNHIYINDVVKAIIEIIKINALGTINLATDLSISFAHLAETIASIMSNNIEVVTSERQNPITHRYFNIAKLYEILPDFTFTSLEQGLKLTIDAERSIK